MRRKFFGSKVNQKKRKQKNRSRSAAFIKTEREHIKRTTELAKLDSAEFDRISQRLMAILMLK